jgi:hypothetical protein
LMKLAIEILLVIKPEPTLIYMNHTYD